MFFPVYLCRPSALHLDTDGLRCLSGFPRSSLEGRTGRARPTRMHEIEQTGRANSSFAAAGATMFDPRIWLFLYVFVLSTFLQNFYPRLPSVVWWIFKKWISIRVLSGRWRQIWAYSPNGCRELDSLPRRKGAWWIVLYTVILHGSRWMCRFPTFSSHIVMGLSESWVMILIQT